MPDLEPDQVPAALSEHQRAYEEWFRQYVDRQQRKCSGVYRASDGKLTVREPKPRRLIGWLKGMRGFGFFPRTRIPRFQFPSDEETLARDSVLVGTDLYAAIQKCKP